MKARVLKAFKDVDADAVRMAGDTFECTEERFADICAKLDGYIEAVKQTPKQSAKRAIKSKE